MTSKEQEEKKEEGEEAAACSHRCWGQVSNAFKGKTACPTKERCLPLWYSCWHWWLMCYMKGRLSGKHT